MSFLKKLAVNKRGATAIEYALIAGLVAVVAVTALTTVGTNVAGKFSSVGTSIGTSS